MGLGKKAFIFTMDAFLAASILLAGLILISQYAVKEHPKESVQYITTDLLNALSQIRMEELSPSRYAYYNSSSIYTESALTLIEQIGTYWAANETTLASELAQEVLSGLLPNNTGFQLELGSDVLFNQTFSSQTDVYVADRMITGVMQGAPLEGSTSSAYLRKIKDKRTSSYAYFGGFVGQGNITVFIDVPSDVTADDVTRMTLEGDPGGNFTVYLNGNQCMNLSSTTSNMTPEVWNLTGCNESISPGRNNISLSFQSQSKAYIAGGHLRIDFKTDDLLPSISSTSRTYYFPDIRGIVNLYDSFYVPGNLTSMTLYLHYLADHNITAYNDTFYLTIGNTTVLADTDSTTEQSLTFDDFTLQTILNYTNLNQKTVPLRMGFENISYDSQLLGNSEVMLITDVSGSMDWKMIGADYDSGTRRNCDNADLNDSDTQRLSVAKCLDKQFAEDVLNISGNTIGLVSYATSTVTGSTVSPTTNLTLIYSTVGTADPQVGYTPTTSTCICCGINSGRDQLVAGASRTTLIATGSSWLYETNSFQGAPANDTEGDAWYEIDYDDSAWPGGSAVLGHYVSGSVAVTTELSTSNITADQEYVNLWEHSSDVAGAPNDFTSSIINSTANTFGISGSDDGWDWAGGSDAFGYDDTVDYNGASGGHLNLDFRTGGSNNNACSGYDCSGAYGIEVNITSEMLSFLAVNGSAMLSFDYEWDGNDNPFESNDEVWIKAKWILPNGTEYYLGDDLDTLHSNGDTDPEIYSVDDPDQEFSGTALLDLTSMIPAAGSYYLVLGAKLRASASDEWGYVYFDNVQLRVSNNTDRYYFRKHFTLASTATAQRGFINLLSDDRTKIYVNGNVVFEADEDTNGTYWDRRGIPVAGRYFRTGDNVVAVELSNDAASAKFDLQLIGVNKSGSGAMLVMTDGQANVECTEQGYTGDLDGDGSSDTGSDDAIQAACDAREDWGIQVFAVGFSSSADEPTLSGIALCGEGLYAKSDNVSALADFYNQVVLNIISATVKSQTIILSGGNLSASNLYGDSYLSYTFVPLVGAPEPNEIGVEMQTVQFGNCNPTVDIPLGIRVMDAKVTSYSGEHWTKLLRVNSNTVFNLSEYSSNYINLGDPYIIQAPANLLTNGPNTIYIETGDEPINNTGCSPNNTLIYTALVPSTTSRSEVVEKTDGCEWRIQFEDDFFNNKSIPGDYSGAKRCSYTESNHTLSDGAYDPVDAYDIAVFNLLKALDFDNNGKVFVNLDAEDIEIVITTISSVPYLWGPSIVKAKVWQ
ncbi:hypothetical protein JW826_05665 [Candidatus Woesearchaeota archaeon]|nr:hypothetical protein [Candidatus Woesearchaeota archaeon]